MSQGRHRARDGDAPRALHSGSAGHGRHGHPQAPPGRSRPWLAALSAVLAASAASLAAVVDDPRLLRLAVVLGIASAVPLGIAMLVSATASAFDGRRLSAEVAALRGAVEELARRPAPSPVVHSPVAFAVASSYSGVAPGAGSVTAERTAHRVIDLSGATTSTSVEQPRRSRQFVLDLAALEEEVEPGGRGPRQA